MRWSARVCAVVLGCGVLLAGGSVAIAFPTSTGFTTFTIWTIAGNGTACSTSPACGDGGPATSAQLNTPQGVAVDAAGNVYITDASDNEVRKVSPSGTISLFAGDGAACSTPAACGDGG